jgi:hypothetical protein
VTGMPCLEIRKRSSDALRRCRPANSQTLKITGEVTERQAHLRRDNASLKNARLAA